MIRPLRPALGPATGGDGGQDKSRFFMISFFLKKD
jgi:hypothetical protein